MKPLKLDRVRFSNRRDVVKSNSGIFNPTGSQVKTLKGGDEIIGNQSINSDFGLGLFANVAAINAGAIGAADISAKATVNTDGIENKGSIATNEGKDLVRGSARAQISAQANAVSNAIAYANKLNTGAIAETFANINVDAIANGINNTGNIGTGKDGDSVDGKLVGSVTAVATAKANAIAFVQAIAKARVNRSLIAFADAIAESLADATITATAIKNVGGRIDTKNGPDTINATATSDSNTLAETSTATRSASSPRNQALATAVAVAIAEAEDTAIAIDNTRGFIAMGNGKDTLKANANGESKGIAIQNSRGTIKTGRKGDIIEAYATGIESYGIFGGTIDTGNGADRVKASSFGGGVNIRMGNGDDFVEGFGDAKLYGGDDFDILSFGSSSFEDFRISLGGSSNQLNFEQNGITMNTAGFEQFNFNNGSFSYDQLVAKL
ncbi:MAG: hypothetical protein AAFV71_32005 [Cyanobacteria bacterium J06633_8]